MLIKQLRHDVISLVRINSTNKYKIYLLTSNNHFQIGITSIAQKSSIIVSSSL